MMKVSFIVTGFNCERYAQTCIQSLLDQTYKNCEILVYDDGSTDKTLDILRQYPDISVLHSKENRGALFGRYYLSKIATGDIVFIAALDDYYPLNAAEIIVSHYTPEIKMTYGSWKYHNGDDYIAEEYEDRVWELRSFRHEVWKATAPQTFRRELIDKIPLERLQHDGQWLKNCTDLALTFPMLEICKKEEVVVIKEIAAVYHSNHSNTTLKRYGRADKTRIKAILSEMPVMPIEPS